MKQYIDKNLYKNPTSYAYLKVLLDRILSCNTYIVKDET